ncbi:MAG: FecR family protein [Opitutaceae bacterium]
MNAPITTSDQSPGALSRAMASGLSGVERPRHRNALQRFDSAWAALDRPANRGTIDCVLADLATLARRQRRRRLASVATVCLLLIGGVSGWRVAPVQPGSAAAPTQSSNAVVLLPARQILPDGSVVELKAGAEIAADFTPAFRRIVLRRGAAYFQVTKNALRPFIVEASGVQIRAVGTAFCVELGKTEIDVVVAEGRVAVEKSKDIAALATGSLPGAVASDSAPLAFVEAGNRVAVSVAAQSLVSASVTPVPANQLNQRLAWRAPRLEFTGTPLSEAVALLNKHADSARGIRFVIEDASIAKEQISGLFRADNADAFVGLLEAGFDIKAGRRSETEIILRKAR